MGASGRKSRWVAVFLSVAVVGVTLTAVAAPAASHPDDEIEIRRVDRPPRKAPPGQPYVYSFEVTNTGAAKTVDVTHEIPGTDPSWNRTCVAADGACAKFTEPAAGPLRDTLTLAAGESAEYFALTTIAAGTPIGTRLAYRVDIDVDGDARRDVGKRLGSTRVVAPVVEFEVTKTAPRKVPFGEVLQYVVTVTHVGNIANGPTPASLVDVLPDDVGGFGFSTDTCDTLPPPALPSIGSVSCSSEEGGLGDRLEVLLGSDWQPGSSQTFAIRAAVNRPVPSDAKIVNVATVTYTDLDGAQQSDTAKTKTVLNPDAGEVVDVTFPDPPPYKVTRNELYRYDFALTNSGPSAVSIDVGHAPRRVDIQWNRECLPEDGLGRCDDLGVFARPRSGPLDEIVVIPPGETVDYFVLASTAARPGRYVDHPVDVGKEHTHPPHRTKVLRPIVDFTLTKLAPAETGGEPFTYVITVENTGTATTGEIGRITDVFPDEVRVLGLQRDGCSVVKPPVLPNVDFVPGCQSGPPISDVDLDASFGEGWLPGSTDTWTVVVQPAEGTEPGTVITNTARATWTVGGRTFTETATTETVLVGPG